MEKLPLRDIRLSVKLTQDEAAQKIHDASRGFVNVVPNDRRLVLNTEKYGTDRLSLLEGMAAAYDVSLDIILAANRATLKQKPKQKPPPRLSPLAPNYIVHN